MTDTTLIPPRDKKRAIFNGLKGTCPSCGKAALFRSYLKPVNACSSCQTPWDEIRADDGPAWATMLITGHLLAPLFHFLAVHEALPMWAPGLILVSVGVALSLAILPRVKGAFMGFIWAGRIPTS